MATTYFDPTWGGEQLGTLAKPYVSWAGRTMALGSTWGLRYGTTTTAPLAPFGDGGAEGTRRLIGVYEPMTGAIMDDVKGGAFIDATGLTQGVYIGPARAYITISGFDIFGANSYCIYKDSAAVTTEQHIWVENCNLHDSLGMGADLRGKGNKVLNTDVHDNNSDGLFIGGNDAEIGWCKVWGNARVGATGDGVQFYNSSNFNIHDTDIEHLAPSKQALIANFDSVPATTGGQIINTRMVCRQYVAGVTLADQKTMMIVNPGVTVRGCIIEGGQYGAFLQGPNITLEDSLIVVNGSGLVVGVAIRQSGVKVHRSTVIGRTDQAGAYGIDHSSTTYTGVDINNNVLRGWGKAIRTMVSGASYSRNAFENNGVNNSTSAGLEGAPGTGDLLGDLMLSESYRPMAGSILIGAGSAPTETQYDADGQVRPNPPSIGAYEPFQYSLRKYYSPLRVAVQNT